MQEHQRFSQEPGKHVPPKPGMPPHLSLLSGSMVPGSGSNTRKQRKGDGRGSHHHMRPNWTLRVTMALYQFRLRTGKGEPRTSRNLLADGKLWDKAQRVLVQSPPEWPSSRILKSSQKQQVTMMKEYPGFSSESGTPAPGSPHPCSTTP